MQKEIHKSFSPIFSSNNSECLKISMNSSRHMNFFYPGLTLFIEYLLKIFSRIYR